MVIEGIKRKEVIRGIVKRHDKNVVIDCVSNELFQTSTAVSAEYSSLMTSPFDF